MKKISLMLAGIAVLMLAASCSSDDGSNNSSLPKFSGISFDVDDVQAGVGLKATAVQSAKGKLLDLTNYTWTLTYANSDSTLKTSSVVYDKDNSDPTCSFFFPSIGSYTLTFQGSYRVSGSMGNSTVSQKTDDGTVTYVSSALTAKVTVTKRITVREGYSSLPEFTDMLFSADNLVEGNYVKATANQNNIGILLGQSNYVWKLTDSEGNDSTLFNLNLDYSKQSINPSATFKLPAAGNYTLTFSAAYALLGTAGNYENTMNITDGTIKYSLTTDAGAVVIKKNISVKPEE